MEDKGIDKRLRFIGYNHSLCKENFQEVCNAICHHKRSRQNNTSPLLKDAHNADLASLYLYVTVNSDEILEWVSGEVAVQMQITAQVNLLEFFFIYNNNKNT